MEEWDRLTEIMEEVGGEEYEYVVAALRNVIETMERRYEEAVRMAVKYQTGERLHNYVLFLLFSPARFFKISFRSRFVFPNLFYLFFFISHSNRFPSKR